ncbi:thiol:disulfide interchange protein DsbC [Duganella caerulea]|uniref:DsbC family protein n=1 Tax=Duganella caerulea TaxID=2885762 RepID=UPI0030EA8DCB
MKQTTALLLAASLLALPAANAETPAEARIKALITPRLGVNIKVDSVTKTPYGGLYEISTNGDIFYTDESARYLFVGKVVDTANNYQDLTRARADQLAAIHFSELPLETAIKTVKGNGKRVMAVFEDPNCPYCRKLHQTLEGIDNVTIYTFLLNILSDDSAVKSKDIWCAANRAQSWHDWIVNAKPAPAAPAACPTPNEQVLALGKKLHVAGTPTIYFSDGTRTGTAFDKQALEAKLDATAR